MIPMMVPRAITSAPVEPVTVPGDDAGAAAAATPFIMDVAPTMAKGAPLFTSRQFAGHTSGTGDVFLVGGTAGLDLSVILAL
jgi:hypothetical protein